MGSRWRRRDAPFVGIRDARNAYAVRRERVYVDVFAVVLEFGFPRKSNGTDYCLNLRVIDHTHNCSGMGVNIFTIDELKLHHVATPGDIIRLTQFYVSPYKDELLLVSDKKVSSHALYKGKVDNDFLPYQFCSKYRPRVEDRRLITELRSWFVNFQFQEDLSRFTMLSEIKKGSFDFACKILHCWEVEDKWGFLVWDGTDAPPNDISAKLEDEISSPLCLTLSPLSLSRELLRTLPTFATTLLITVDKAVVKTQLDVLNIGKWIKFVFLKFDLKDGLWYGIFTPHTKIRYTPNEDTLIIERQRLYKERMSRSLQLGTIPFSCGFPNSPSVTEVNHENVLPVTLREVLTHPEVTARFTCVVRVVAAMPGQADNLLSRDGRYRLRLTLEDPTARIHAYVLEEDGETLFGGYPGIDVLSRKLNRLIGVAEGDGNMEAPRNPPWVSVCIKSFYRNETDVWGSRAFRIFDTKIVEEA